METLELLRRRSENLEDLQQIVRTMKALSAVSIRQYERAAESLAEYERTVALGLQAVLRDPGHRLPAPKPGQGEAVVIFGTDHGLCGRFNEVITEQALAQHSIGQQQTHQRWLAVGERLAAALEHQREHQARSELRILALPGSATAITELVQRVLLQLDAWRRQGVGRVELWHNRPTSRSGYRPCHQRLYPLDPEPFQAQASRPWPSRCIPQYSLGWERLLGRLLRQHYFVVLFRACAESLAAEHGSRLAAMQTAGKNIDEHLQEVTARFRRVRQAHITSELLDVVSGFEAAAPAQPPSPPFPR
ncbi:F0F1 ATP synthase subunit gamma [Thiohalocapsa marina]|uniref:F0F1 ATP synthase subunit gamma n=1 Tax=Thiohalocapsa marina TaxID=424902 RepID=A0A5M8FN86_9GAMM|nr:F0F1 ATP synthase subunit gamma [Thiohalocapsa marina]KAA6186199.1 F0F1 ATP synthase subunit gamma [Thiohalocapsa marina]